MTETKKELCAKCAAILAGTRDVKRVEGGVDNKVTCSSCGRRRYGGTYEVSGAAGRKNKGAERSGK